MRATIAKGRGSTAEIASRLATFERVEAPHRDDWAAGDETAETGSADTEVRADRSRTIIARNTSPDIGFDRSINTYRGCEHGCVYCYARPGHGYLDHSPGLDFERILYAKHDAAELLRSELTKPSYRPAPLALGAVTDVYQPVEGRLGLTRAVLEVLLEARHPVRIITKSSRILRDVDLLQALAADGLVQVDLSLTTLDKDLARKLEPRASAPYRRLAAIAGLHTAGVPVGVSTSPVIPGLTDHELERLLAAAADAGAEWASYIVLRLPFEVAPLFEAWLEQHYPDRKAKILNRLREMRGGKLNDPRFHSRMNGHGVHAELIQRRFVGACERLGLDRRHTDRMPTNRFRLPGQSGTTSQLDLFAA